MEMGLRARAQIPKEVMELPQGQPFQHGKMCNGLWHSKVLLWVLLGD